MPKHLWMADGHLLWWYFKADTSEASSFMIGRESIRLEEGLRLLAGHGHGRDGQLLGPVQLPPTEAINLRRRPRRGRRW